MFAWDHICANFGKPGRLTHHAILRKMLNVLEFKSPSIILQNTLAADRSLNSSGV